jgi:hypothetical protein
MCKWQVFLPLWQFGSYFSVLFLPSTLLVCLYDFFRRGSVFRLFSKTISKLYRIFFVQTHRPLRVILLGAKQRCDCLLIS